MSEFKGTPGPWSIEPDRSHPNKVWHVVGDSTVVCGLDGIASPYRSNDRTFDEDKANMVLIAASPDLLEALQMCEKLLVGVSYTDYPVEDELTTARAAIAKALGEQK